MTVHNHGPAEGRGLNCPERLLPDGTLRGACLLPVDTRGGICGSCAGPLAWGVCLGCGQRRHGEPRFGE